MSKFWDYILTDGDWEKTQRIQFYKEIAEIAKGMSKEELIALKDLMEKMNRKVTKK